MSKEEILKRIDKINRKYSKDNKTEEIPRLQLAKDMQGLTLTSTGNPALDNALGGGLPEGFVTEIFGAPGCGKSMSSYYVIAEIQKKYPNSYVIYYSTEDPIKPSNAWKIAGVNEDTVIFIDARNYGEDGLDRIRDLILDEDKNVTDDIKLIIIDSIAALAPKAETNSIDEGFGGATMGTQARLSSKFLRAACGEGWLRKRAIMLLINQERAQIGSTPLPNVTPGGKAVTYYPKVRIKLKRPTSGLLSDPDTKEIIGHTIDFEVTKNNSGSYTPFKTGSWKVIYNKGIDKVGPVISEGIESGTIKPLSSRSYKVRWLTEDGLKESGNLLGLKNVTNFVENTEGCLEGLLELNQKTKDFLREKEYIVSEGSLFSKNGESLDFDELFFKNLFIQKE